MKDTTVSERVIVRAMNAAQRCADRIESGQSLHTGDLKLVCRVQGDDSTILDNRPESAFLAPTSPKQQVLALCYFASFIADCRMLLRDKRGARRG